MYLNRKNNNFQTSKSNNSMENSPSTAKTGLKWGLITGLGIVAYTAILYVVGVATSSPLMYVSYAILIAGIVMAMREYKSKNEDYMSYGQGLGIGSFIGTITGLLVGAFTTIYMKYVDTTMAEKQLDVMRAELEKSGQTPEQIDQIVSMSQSFMSPGIMFGASVLTYLIIAFIFSLVISAVLRKNQPEIDF